MLAQNKRLYWVLGVAIAILSIPFFAMQFNAPGVDWDATDFLVMGVLLLSTGFAIELVLRKVKKTQHRILLCVGILILLFLIWAELAVGIFGTPFAGS